MKTFFAIALTAFYFSTAAYAADIRHIKKTVLGCQTQQLYDRIAAIATEGDRDALKRLMLASLLSGDCVLLEARQAVYFEDYAWGGDAKVRPKGSVVSYWTNAEMVVQ